MSVQVVEQLGNAAQTEFPISSLQRDSLERSSKTVDILVCQEQDNSVRWQVGERLQHLFEQRCDQFATEGDTRHLAVESAEGVWTYSELDARANQLARYLRDHGLGASSKIALLFDKSVYSYISMLAVLKIHAAYVPLDPNFPADRIAFITADSEVDAILTMSLYRAMVGDIGPTVLCIDEGTVQIDQQSRTRLNAQEVEPPINELCYIIYTSGSTGRPKGVPIEHASICNFVRVAAETYGYNNSDRVYQGLTIAFDFAVEEIWVPLSVGATLLPNQTGSSLLGHDLAEFLRTRKITAMCCVPTLLATIDEILPDLRLLIVSGEACPKDLITRWYSPMRTILNAYGPTETTVTATVSKPTPGQAITIGHPLPTYSIVILRPGENQILPFGETGEIGIAGIGVANGYLNRNEQTQQAFIHDFLNIPNNPSGHIYRTGDLGRVNEHGEVEYLGRIDTQVKIRGYRIELTEIESVMLRIPQISQVVVDTFEPLAGVKELVAYYTLRTKNATLTPDEIVRELRTLLPNYMVPAYYEQLSSIPMLASDKADRKSLPRPSGARMHTAGRQFIEPRGSLEADIAGVLARLLKLDKVSVEDNFFDDLGANSLLMAQFSALLRKELGVTDVSMREIYRYPTLRQLAEFLGTVVGQRAPLRSDKHAHVAPNWQYYSCGMLQLLSGFTWIYFNVYIWWQGYDWIMAAQSQQTAYARSITFTVISFAVFALIPVMVKWILIGRWKPEEFPVWSFKYLRFWIVKQLVRSNPLVLYAGTPLYLLYLKMLGARVSWKSAVFSAKVPVCTDLVSIGANSIVSKNVTFTGYSAESGRIRTGYVTLSRDSFVGEASVLDINTVMEAGSELAHASALHDGQRLSVDSSYHGSPAQPTAQRFRKLPTGNASPLRMILFSLLQLASLFFVYLPLPFLIAHHYFGANHQHASITIADTLSEPASLLHLPSVLEWTSLFFIGIVLAGFALVIILPRCLNILLQPDKIYPLYGIHFFIHRTIERLSNSKLYNVLFGDSSFIIYYLKAIGYRFRGVEQTGSNFGLSQHHDNPFLCEIGKGTMVSDGFIISSTEYSSTTFRVAKVSLGARNFLGNAILYPPHGRTGENCLLGTKVMIPTAGPLRENVGLLGSPCFEIPRSVRRDSQFDYYKQADVRRQRLQRKNASNLLTMVFFLLSNCIALNITTVAWYFSYGAFHAFGPLYLTILATATMTVLTFFYIFIDRASLLFRRLQPQYCSIYDDYFWKHERFWKIGMSNDHFLMTLLNGTPFKSLVWRALGVQIGKQLFDDGASIPEKTLVIIGDNCTLNDQCTLQSHSLEDGTFKSDHIIIGNRCTIGTNCYVHYGVQMEDEVTLEPDSFLMKGERPQARSTWQGNPAKELLA